MRRGACAAPPNRRTTEEPMAISSDNSASTAVRKPARGCGGCLAVAFGGLFLAAGLFMLWLMMIKPLLDIMAARNWQPTDCIVVSSDLKSDGDGDTSRLVVVYK